MNLFKQLIGATLLSMGAFGLFVACGGETACETDADCADGETCVAEVCDDGSGNNTTNNNTNNTTGNNTNSNNTTGNNTTGGVTYNFVQVEDTTTGAGCDERDPGSDMMYGYLADSTGTPLGFAAIVDENIITEENDFTSGADALTGAAPTGGLDSCPEFSADSVTALGCGGSVYVNFEDATGTPLAIDPAVHDVVFAEYSTQCGGSADDTYSINVCTDSIAAGSGDWASCTLVIGTGSGEITGSFL